MALIVIIGGQAVGKMTVGVELEKQIDGKLLYNHQTIDLYADFLGYTEETFKLSDFTRKKLFKAFAENSQTNLVKHLIFTVMIAFNEEADRLFLRDIATIFQEQEQAVYFVQLVTDLQTRLKRNTTPQRLAAKPSKRDIAFSQQEILTSNEKYQLAIPADDFAALYPEIACLTIDNTQLSPEDCSTQIVDTFKLKGARPC